MTKERTYSDMARELLEYACTTDLTIWDFDSEELAQNVSAAMSFIFFLSRLDAKLLDLRRMKDNGHEMSFEDYVMDKQIVDYLKMLRRRWGTLQNIILAYVNSDEGEISQDHEMTWVNELTPCGNEEAVKEFRQSMLDFCQARCLTYKAMQPLLIHYREIAMDSMLRILRERKAFVSSCRKEYEVWARRNALSIERRLKNGLYKNSLYGRTIIPLQSTSPCREHWGEALGLKMQQIRMDGIYNFIDDDEFHEVGSPIQLTNKLLTMALVRITQHLSASATESLSYEDQMKIFYRHIAEINMLKEEIEKLSVQKEDDGTADTGADEHKGWTAYPAMPVLEQYVREAIEKKKTAKYILMPVRAAREAGVLIPIHDVKSMNEYFRTDLTKQNWSQWVNGTAQPGYDPKELSPMTATFRKLL